MLDAVALAPTSALGNVWSVQVGPAATRTPLSVAMRAFWAAAPAVPGLLARADPLSPAIMAAHLVAEDTGGAAESIRAAPRRAERFEALGRLLGKSLVEGLAVEVEFAPILYASLLCREAQAMADSGSALAHLAAWDEAAASAHRATMARRLGAGSHVLTADMYAGPDAGDAPVTDATKRALVCAAIERTLLRSRRANLEALRSGFTATATSAGIEPALPLLSEWELGAFITGGAAAAGTAAGGLPASRVVWDAAWRADDPQRAHLAAALAALSAPARRVLLARATGRLRLLDGGAPVLLVIRRDLGAGGDVTPRLPGNGLLELAPTCPSAEAFLARLLAALDLRADAAAGAPRTAADDLRAEQRAAIAALQAAGGAKKGAIYACPNGHLYAIGDCGGAMERSVCPECGAAIGGDGTLGGSLSLEAGAQFLFSLNNVLTVNGPIVAFGNFGIGDLVGLDGNVANGAYTIIDGAATIDFAGLANLGQENAHDIGGGKQAYFSTGSLVVNVVPEPSTYALLALGAIGMLIALRRRKLGYPLI
jgi:hypothetical protein